MHHRIQSNCFVRITKKNKYKKETNIFIKIKKEVHKELKKQVYDNEKRNNHKTSDNCIVYQESVGYVRSCNKKHFVSYIYNIIRF